MSVTPWIVAAVSSALYMLFAFGPLSTLKGDDPPLKAFLLTPYKGPLSFGVLVGVMFALFEVSEGGLLVGQGAFGVFGQMFRIGFATTFSAFAGLLLSMMVLAYFVEKEEK